MFSSYEGEISKWDIVSSSGDITEVKVEIPQTDVLRMESINFEPKVGNTKFSGKLQALSGSAASKELELELNLKAGILNTQVNDFPDEVVTDSDGNFEFEYEFPSLGSVDGEYILNIELDKKQIIDISTEFSSNDIEFTADGIIFIIEGSE